MPRLTVHLHRVTNLTDNYYIDVADPYVRFHLTQNNLVFDKNYGRKISSHKKNDMNPIYNEEFVWDEIPTLDNMELRVRVMDDNPGRDKELGFCNIKLEKLHLSAEPLEVRRKVEENFFSPDSWIVLYLSYGDPVEDKDAEGLSHIGTAAYEILRSKHAVHHLELWNVTSGRVVGELHQTPKEAFPGITPEFPDGHDDWFPDIMGEVLSRTKIWADVLSLSAPTGKFVTQLKVALDKIAESAAGSEKPVIIRMMFGNIVGSPTNCSSLIKELTEDLSPNANIRLWVGAWRKGSSWNHAKIIAVDGKYLHTGGHNMWDPHYLESEPIHDLSLEIEGRVTLDGHRYANRQWEFIETKQETFWGTIGSAIPDFVPQAAPNRVTISEWPRGKATEHAPSFRKHYLGAITAEHAVDDAIPVISMGRYGALTHVDRPADDAIVAMIDASKTIIRLALQDLGPICIPGTQIPGPGLGWPKEYFSAFGRAIWKRGVDVEIVLSNPASTPGGLNPMFACYGNGWTCSEVASEIIKTIRKQFPNAEDGQLRQKVAENLRICFIREERGSTWENGMNIGLHSKHFIIDDTAMYIGSQNLYMCDLAEWGVLIDDPGQVQKAMEEYWNPLWQYSHTGEDMDVQEVMDGLDIDRDGADPSTMDDDMRKKMHQAELANYGVSGDHYEEE